MPKDAKFRDLILAVRADKAINGEINHYYADLVRDEDIDQITTEYKRHQKAVKLKQEETYVWKKESSKNY